MYNYHTNSRGDVIGVSDQDGNIQVTYEYDSWGKITKSDVKDTALKNQPFKYASYFYDEETNQYYLNSPYYNSEHGTFLSSDSLINQENTVSMSNGYTYSSNNPIILTDPQGTQDTRPDVSVPASTGGGGGFFGFTFKEKILSCVSRITNKNDIHHILLKHHKWNTISSGKWNDVQHIISWAMKNGTRKKLSKNVYRRIATHPEYNITIEVRYTYVKGKIRISDAWVVK